MARDASLLGACFSLDMIKALMIVTKDSFSVEMAAASYSIRITSRVFASMTVDQFR